MYAKYSMVNKKDSRSSELGSSCFQFAAISPCQIRQGIQIRLPGVAEFHHGCDTHECCEPAND